MNYVKKPQLSKVNYTLLILGNQNYTVQALLTFSSTFGNKTLGKLKKTDFIRNLTVGVLRFVFSWMKP